MTPDRKDPMFETAEACVKSAAKHGAQECSARAYRVRDVTVQWRDGKVEQINEATTRGVGLQLYVDGRYASVSSSDLRPDALDSFIAESIAMTRSLAKDPHRSLADPKLYEGQAKKDLQLEDPKYLTVSAEQRRSYAQEMEAAARAVKGAEAILSVTTGFNDNRSEIFRVHSNGFAGSRADTSFWTFAQVSVKDGDGRRPEDYSYNGVRFIGELPAVADVGKDAAQRALSRLGSKKGDSAVMTMAVDHRAAGRLLQALAGPLQASALQQKRSFLEGKLGQRIGSSKLTIVDDPWLVKGFGSRLFDGEGISAKPITFFDEGVLKSYYVDTYYGKKLGIPPTTGSPSNVVLKPGERSQPQLLADMKEGILVTGFLGGNSNSTTGDYSFGVQGFRVRAGQLAEPVAEMNISGNLGELMQRLSAVGNDPYPYSTVRVPTLVFEGVQFAGN
jgi:PmbA protein